MTNIASYFLCFESMRSEFVKPCARAEFESRERRKNFSFTWLTVLSWPLLVISGRNYFILIHNPWALLHEPFLKKYQRVKNCLCCSASINGSTLIFALTLNCINRRAFYSSLSLLQNSISLSCRCPMDFQSNVQCSNESGASDQCYRVHWQNNHPVILLD